MDVRSLETSLNKLNLISAYQQNGNGALHNTLKRNSIFENGIQGCIQVQPTILKATFNGEIPLNDCGLDLNILGNFDATDMKPRVLKMGYKIFFSQVQPKKLTSNFHRPPVRRHSSESLRPRLSFTFWVISTRL